MLGMEEASTSEERAFKVVVSIVLPLIFLICTLESVEFHRHLNAQDETAYWEPVNATVLSSEVVVINCDGEDGCDVLPEIIYEYEVDGRLFTAQRITYTWDVVTDERLHHEEQWRVVEDFPAGEEVTAYVHPEERGQSVLYASMMGESDVYYIVQDQLNATVPFVFILPVAYVLLIRFGPPVIRARVRKAAEQRQGVSETLAYFSSPSPAEERARLADESRRPQQPEIMPGLPIATPPASTPMDGGVNESVVEQGGAVPDEKKPEDNVPFWIDP